MYVCVFREIGRLQILGHRLRCVANTILFFYNLIYILSHFGTSLVVQMVKASAYNAGDPGSIPGLERSPGEGNDNPLQYSCLENPMDRGAW